MLVLSLAISAGACRTVDLAPPQIRSGVGPAANRPIKRVVALPATCGSLEPLRSGPTPARKPEPVPWQPVPPPSLGSRLVSGCSASALSGVDQKLRSALDFTGLEVIDAERINALTGARRESQQDGGAAVRVRDHVGFEDATPIEQTQLLRQLGADALVSMRLWIGASVGLAGRRTVTVQIRMVAAADGAMVWAKRCELEVAGLTASDEDALERGAACAIAALRQK